MPITGPDSRLYVVVGIISDSHGKFLVQQRAPGKPCAGLWEFPGGKVEENESPETALTRELFEELGILVQKLIPLTKLAYDYDHAKVWLDVFRVTDFEGAVSNREGQRYSWQTVEEISQMNILDAVLPILEVIRSQDNSIGAFS